MNLEKQMFDMLGQEQSKMELRVSILTAIAKSIYDTDLDPKKFVDELEKTKALIVSDDEKMKSAMILAIRYLEKSFDYNFDDDSKIMENIN